ncbi:unnamed protein product [Camellia sinensis]
MVLGTPTNIADVLKNTLLEVMELTYIKSKSSKKKKAQTVEETQDCLTELPEPLLHHSFILNNEGCDHDECLGKTVIKRMRSLESEALIVMECLVCNSMQRIRGKPLFRFLMKSVILKSLDYVAATFCGEGRDFITFAVTCLRIKTGLTKWELPGIAYMLRHSPNIETLIISIDKNEEKKRMTSQIANLILEMENTGKCRSQIFTLFDLKTVKLYYFMRNLHGRMSTTTAELLEQLQNKMNFLRFLLKNLKVLEKMIITTCKGNYQTWAVSMTAYLQAVDLWEAVEADYEIVPLPDNPTIQEIKIHKERTTKKYKAKSCLHSAVSEVIFTKIMTLESAKNIWDYLRTESQGNDRSRSMQVMNLRREFEIQRMKESETIKEYSDRLLSIVNKVRLLGEDLSDRRVVEKILVTIPERFESKISSLEESKDLTSISLAEFLNALQAQEQRRLIRQEGFVEGALKAKLQIQDKSKGKKKTGNKDNSSKGNAEVGDNNNKGGTYPQCQHCKKTNHPQSKCWWRPDIKCRKCNQLSHIEKEEEHLFVASCYASKNSNEHWFVDSGCTNHMTYDKELFKELDRTKISKVKVGNGEFIEVRGKGTVAIKSVLDKKCMIRDADGREAWVENQSGCKMQVLRSDNDKENTSEQFDLFCEEAGIEHQLTTPYTPQQNGVTERKNRTLMEMTRCLLHEKVLQKKFWAEAANTAIFLLNRLPTRALKRKTPFEVKRDKLDKKAEPGVFIVRGTRLLSDIYQRCNVAVTEPAGFEEAKNDQKWMEAMKEEMRMIEKNHTWELMEKPQNRKIIGVKWVFRTKLNADGSVKKYKARLVVKGYAQIYGVDFSETFAPVARLDTIRLLLAIAAQKDWKIYQLDVKSVFLNGFLQEEIYVEQPEGFVIQGHEDKVYLLKKALYGLKQAPRAWYSRIDSHLLSLGFVKSLSEFTLYVKEATDLIVVSVYVDDLLITGSNEDLIKEFKAEMLKVFEMTDLGLMSYFLGMEVKQRQHEKEKFSKDDGVDKVDEGLYRSLTGCLMYLTATRPNIMHAVSLLSRFMHCASEVHFQAAKRILRYIKGTVNYGIKFTHCSDFKFHGFFNSDWGGSIDDMRSTTGFCFSFGSGMFSWCSRKQEIIAQSTAEAEYVAATAAVNQALWFRKLEV